MGYHIPWNAGGLELLVLRSVELHLPRLRGEDSRRRVSRVVTAILAEVCRELPWHCSRVGLFMETIDSRALNYILEWFLQWPGVCALDEITFTIRRGITRPRRFAYVSSSSLRFLRKVSRLLRMVRSLTLSVGATTTTYENQRNQRRNSDAARMLEWPDPIW